MENAKVFYESGEKEIEKEINKWLNKMGNRIEITRVIPGVSGQTYFSPVIFIFYKERYHSGFCHS
ncbi:MAG TPA: hypothetical protein VKO42_00875 [Patescibacteria group bacterium]|nr:hypothetical protein [Patescibacteria group bacterium]